MNRIHINSLRTVHKESLVKGSWANNVGFCGHGDTQVRVYMARACTSGEPQVLSIFSFCERVSHWPGLVQVG